MLSFEEARQKILDSVTPIGIERVELLESLGRAAAENVPAPLNLPVFDNSAMDGYAVRVSDLATFPSLKVSHCTFAGSIAPASMASGCAVKVMTGAPVPPDCDAVVPIEEAEEFDGSVRIRGQIVRGQHIRRAGEDIGRGETALAAGTPIRVPEISLLASLGRTSVTVFRRPRVAILATGDELVDPGQPLSPGTVFNSNSLAIAAAVREVGATPLVLGIAADTRGSLRQKLAEGLCADALITAAGVSVGDRDMVREGLLQLDVRQVFWKIEMKPGKSTAFGVKDGKPVFSIPGNPVSAMVTFEELVRPALLKMLGHTHVIKPYVMATLQEDVRKIAGRTQLFRVRLESKNGKLMAWSAGNQDTRFLKTLLQADALAVLPAECSSFSVGDQVSVHLLSNQIGIVESVLRG